MNKNATRYYSNLQENTVAEYIGGKVQPNSGATSFSAGDVVTKDFLVECKTKTQPSHSFTIKEEWLSKNNLERIELGKQYSALVFNFGGELNCTTGYYNYAVIELPLLEKLIQLVERENED